MIIQKRELTQGITKSTFPMLPLAFLRVSWYMLNVFKVYRIIYDFAPITS